MKLLLLMTATAVLVSWYCDHALQAKDLAKADQQTLAAMMDGGQVEILPPPVFK
jgi:hypothetical protein